MRGYFLSTCALFLISIPLEAQVTGICIFDDTDDPASWKTAAIKKEFVNTLDSDAEHIFLTPSLWKAYKNRFKNSKHRRNFCNNYDLFDTHIGLFYINKKKSNTKIGIKIQSFTRISQPFASIKPTSHNYHWATRFHTVFDIQEWQAYYCQPSHKSFIYMNGHGSARSCHLHCCMAAGIPGDKFASLLKFFNDQLKIDIFGMQSCFWTSGRVLKMMNQTYGLKKLHFTIFTPLKTEQTLWLNPFCSQCTCPQCRNIYSFFAGIKKIAHAFSGNINESIKQIIRQIDTLLIEKNKSQHATLITAGTDNIHVIS
ncbi:MAG: hypothetical protein WD055_05190 [Candidatus Dependentiae bacterium]